MLANHAKKFAKCSFGVAMVAFIGTIAMAQENAEQAADEEEEVIDEIVVIAGGKPGDPVDVEALYEEMMRDRLMTDMTRLRVLEEQNEWRGSAATTTSRSSRITWGYSPQDELRFRRESAFPDETFITTRPATVFRFEF